MVELGESRRGEAMRQFLRLVASVLAGHAGHRRVQCGYRACFEKSLTSRNVLCELRERFPLFDIRKGGRAAALAIGSTKQSLEVVHAVFSRFDR